MLYNREGPKKQNRTKQWAAMYPYPGPALDPMCSGVPPHPQFPIPQSVLGGHG